MPGEPTRRSLLGWRVNLPRVTVGVCLRRGSLLGLGWGAVLLAMAPAYAQSVGPNLCLGFDRPAAYAGSGSAGSAGPADEFRLSPSEPGSQRVGSPCKGGPDGILGTGRWGQIAGNALETGRVLFGLRLELKELFEFARKFGLVPPVAKRPGINSLGEPVDELQTGPHTSFLLGGGRHHVSLGVRLEW